MDNRKKNGKKKTRREEDKADQGVIRSVGNGLKSAMDLAVFTGLCAGAGALAGAAAHFYKYAMTPKKHDPRIDKDPLQKDYVAGRRWVKEHPLREDVYIRADDALQLHANFIPAQDRNVQWYAVCVHGYADTSVSMGLYARVYSEQYGMNVLLPDLRGHGLSDGNYVGMGYDDRRDLLRWIDWILERDADAKIILHGISMGAATVMMTTGEHLPSNVMACVEDAGYSSAVEEFRHVYNNLDPKPPVPVDVMMPAFRAVALVRSGYELGQASPVEAVKRSVTPTLFIHGEADSFIPCSMMRKLFAAAACKKMCLLVKGAGHVESVVVDPEGYWAKVDSFLATVAPELAEKSDRGTVPLS